MTKKKLKRRIKKMHVKHVLAMSDIRIKLNDASYRARLAEVMCERLSYENVQLVDENTKLQQELEQLYNEYKQLEGEQDGVLQQTATTKLPIDTPRAEAGNHPIFSTEVNNRVARDAQDNKSDDWPGSTGLGLEQAQ